MCVWVGVGVGGISTPADPPTSQLYHGHAHNKAASSHVAHRYSGWGVVTHGAHIVLTTSSSTLSIT